MGAWSSPYVSQLTSPEFPFPVTMSQMSWVVSLLNLGRLFGAIGGASCINYLGSKTTILIASMPMALCWFFIIVANSVEWLYVARFCGGIGVGTAYSCFSFYLGEIAETSNRGALVALATSGVPIGNLVMSIMGAYLPMKTTAMISLALCVVLIVLFVYLPESPHHLIKKNLDEKAKSSIRWYHRDCDVELEFIALRKFIEDLGKQRLSNLLKDLRTVHFRKSMLIGIVLTTYNQLSGINHILFYMESILTSAKISVIEPAQVVIIVMAFGIVGSGVSMFLMDRCGRKMLMVLSCIGVTLSWCLLTIEFHLLSFGYDPKSVETVSIVAMCTFYTTVFIGILPVPLAMLSEIFAPHLKCVAACLTSILAGVVSFLTAFTYLPLLSALSERYLFLFYALLLATAIPFTIFCVPETKGLSLQEIQSKLVGKKFQE
ncbi:Facilitated trehalose transporter Tret1 [Habropoda laboriosa]|uniref:Facilitated trehalose transporter Tret1 n=2 Tax=Habropoda laboriosa TaxID=597456 RepID=A0A0L7QZJ9_9HYME|nr:Facilitated trehalose transporter Tret1 [Habropoda laboriosa]